MKSLIILLFVFVSCREKLSPTYSGCYINGSTDALPFHLTKAADIDGDSVMAYVVYWVVWESVREPCPEQWLWDLRFGQGASCAVYHGRLIDHEHSAGFFNRDTATAFCGRKKDDHNKSIFNTYDGDTGKERKEFIRFSGSVDSVRLDSIRLRLR